MFNSTNWQEADQLNIYKEPRSQIRDDCAMIQLVTGRGNDTGTSGLPESVISNIEIGERWLVRETLDQIFVTVCFVKSNSNFMERFRNSKIVNNREHYRTLEYSLQHKRYDFISLHECQPWEYW